MKLHDLKPGARVRKAKRRVGRGIAAGQGKTAGRGTKGQKARAGGTIPAWFEGGQTPLHQRIPKLRGFTQPVQGRVRGRQRRRHRAPRRGRRLEGGEMPGAKASKKGAAPDHGQPGDPPRRRAGPPARPADEGPRRRASCRPPCSSSPTRSAPAPAPRSRPRAAPSPCSRCPTTKRPALGVEARPTAAEAPRRCAAPRPRRPPTTAAAAETEADAASEPAEEARPEVAAGTEPAEATARREGPRPRRRPPKRKTPRRQQLPRRPPRPRTTEPQAASPAPASPEPRSPTRTRSRPCSSRCSTPSARRTSGAGSCSSSGSWSSTGCSPRCRCRASTARRWPSSSRTTPAFGILDLFAGGGLSQLSIVGLAMNPYINASIIMQLMTGVIPSLQALSREGEYGRQRLNQYTRYLTVPMALLQAFGILSALSAQSVIIGGFGLGNAQSWVQMITLTAGAVLLMWLGELITEKGIGNGISFIIFAGIVSRAPAGVIGVLEPALAARHRPVRDPGHRRGRRDHLHPGRAAADPDPIREPRPRPAHVPGRPDVPAAAGQPRRRHPDHLRDQHPGLPGPARRLLLVLGGRGRARTSPTRSAGSSRRPRSSTRSSTSC